MNIENMVNIIESARSIALDILNYKSLYSNRGSAEISLLNNAENRALKIETLIHSEIDEWLKNNVKIPCYSYLDFELDILFIMAKPSGEILVEIHKKDLKFGLEQIVEKLNS